ncbi:MAG: hypothetical protein MUP66_00420 [Candidatus Nanohaloarchaeota archaeon QJJ-5]|nr:hypothetical protein [Candidatus Nanohaloarchaeota archaeon QJJ-5]
MTTVPTSVPVILTVVGLGFLIYGFFVAFRFRETLGTGRLAEAWDKLLGLIALFIFGYIAYLAQLISGDPLVDPELITAGIFAAGAIFVATVARLNYQVFSAVGGDGDGE